MRQRRNDFGARVGRDAQKGNVGVHHYCFLLGQRVGEGGGRMLGRGAGGRRRLGWGLWAWPRPTQGAGGSHCNPLLWPWESLRQKQEEKQLEEGGAAQSCPSRWMKFKGNLTWKGKGMASRGSSALLKPQTPGWWCERPSNVLSSQQPKNSHALPSQHCRVCVK